MTAPVRIVTLGSTGITTPQNGFGALPIQRISDEEAVALLRGAWEGGMTFFDTAHSYTDSEHKIGLAFGEWENPRRDQVFIATKTMSTTPEGFWADLEQSLREMRTGYVDIYQFHNPDQVFRPGDGTGMYECMLEAKKRGVIRHIGITAHKIDNAEEAVESGLYETLQYPFNYLSIPREEQLVRNTAAANMGFIGMKGLSGGLLTNARPIMAFDAQFDNLVPIWGIQRASELAEWLSFMDDCPTMDEEVTALIKADRAALQGDFCRSCGYCMPCPMDIQIFQCARMSQLLRRMPPEGWLTEHWQAEMAKIPTCIQCGQCASRCPYGLDTPALLKLNYEDYQAVLAGTASVR